MTDISSNDDVIDARDVLERIAELEYSRDEDPDCFDPDEYRLLLGIKDAAEEAADGGGILISEDYFTQYIRNAAEDTIQVEFDAWPFNYIDWETAARDARSDYSSVEFDGVTFYYQY